MISLVGFAAYFILTFAIDTLISLRAYLYLFKVRFFNLVKATEPLKSATDPTPKDVAAAVKTAMKKSHPGATARLDNSLARVSATWGYAFSANAASSAFKAASGFPRFISKRATQ